MRLAARRLIDRDAEGSRTEPAVLPNMQDQPVPPAPSQARNALVRHQPGAR